MSFTPDEFKKRLITKYPTGVTSDGVAYRDLDATELTRRMVAKYPTGKTSDGVPYADFMKGAEAPAQPENTPFAIDFKAREDNPVSAAMKTLLNIPTSAAKFGINTVKSTAEIPKNLLDIFEGFGAYAKEIGDPGEAAKNVLKGTPAAAYDVLVPSFLKSLVKGDVDASTKAMVEDPVGQIAPLLFAARGFAERAGAAPQFDAVMSHIASPATKGASAAASAVGDVAAGSSKFLGAQATAFNSDTISHILQNPEMFTHESMGKASRIALADEIRDSLDHHVGALNDTLAQHPPRVMADEVRGALDRRLSSLDTQLDAHKPKDLAFEIGGALDKRVAEMGDTALEYGIFRKSKDKRVPAPTVKVNKTFLDELIKRGGAGSDAGAGLHVNKGRIEAHTESSVRDPGDLRALQILRDRWEPAFSRGSLTGDEFLNFREDLSNLSNFERGIGMGKSQPLERFSKTVRFELNAKHRKGFPGMETLDNAFQRQITDMNNLRTGLIDKHGQLLDTSINRIRHSTADGQDFTASKLDALVPGITKRIHAIGDIEDQKQFISRGILDANGNLQDSVINRIAGSTGKGKDLIADQLEDLVPGITARVKFIKGIEDRKAELTKGILDQHGNLLESAINRIANSTGKGKDAFLERIESLVPGITEKVRFVKAVEDIRAAGDQKVGTYARTAIGGTLLYQFNPWLAAIAMLSFPSISLPFLRGLGVAGPHAGRIIKGLGIPPHALNKTPETLPNTAFMQPQEGTSTPATMQ